MGWLYQTTRRRSRSRPYRANTNDGHTRTWLVLAGARVANTVYLAVKSTDEKDPGAPLSSPRSS